jgi:AcrR family transcriptional regulator
VSETKTKYEPKLASVKKAAPGKRRQARGRQRILLLLDVAEQLFAEVGFEATSTNAIAARAGMSPGSLYQFFPNKDAIAEALATRYLEQLRATQAYSFAPEIVHLPLDALIDRVVDPLVALHVAHPGFWTLFGGSTVSPRLATATRDFMDAVHERAEAMFAVRAPHVSPSERARCAKVSVQLIRALLPLVVAADAAERDAVVQEIKAAQRGYLEPIFGGQRLKGEQHGQEVADRKPRARKRVSKSR